MCPGRPAPSLSGATCSVILKEIFAFYLLYRAACESSSVAKQHPQRALGFLPPTNGKQQHHKSLRVRQNEAKPSESLILIASSPPRAWSCWDGKKAHNCCHDAWGFEPQKENRAWCGGRNSRSSPTAPFLWDVFGFADSPHLISAVCWSSKLHTAPAESAYLGFLFFLRANYSREQKSPTICVII